MQTMQRIEKMEKKVFEYWEVVDFDYNYDRQFYNQESAQRFFDQLVEDGTKYARIYKIDVYGIVDGSLDFVRKELDYSNNR